MKLLGYLDNNSSSANTIRQEERSAATPTGSDPASATSSALTTRPQIKVPSPQWHAPWELSAVISGHLGWVRSIAFDPSNEWFVTGSADRTIKVGFAGSSSYCDV